MVSEDFSIRVVGLQCFVTLCKTAHIEIVLLTILGPDLQKILGQT